MEGERDFRTPPGVDLLVILFPFDERLCVTFQPALVLYSRNAVVHVNRTWATVPNVAVLRTHATLYRINGQQIRRRSGTIRRRDPLQFPRSDAHNGRSESSCPNLYVYINERAFFVIYERAFCVSIRNIRLRNTTYNSDGSGRFNTT